MLRLISIAGGIFRIFWVCRVSLADAIVGLAFFGLIVQAQNLMADLSSAGSSANFVFWGGVFGFTFLFWAFPIHYGARRSLDQLEELAPHLKDSYPGLIEVLPRFLGLMPFLALALGIAGARESVRDAMMLDAAKLSMDQGAWLYAADAATAVAFAAFVLKRRSLFPATWTGDFLHPAFALVTTLFFLFAYLYPLPTSVHVPRALLVPPLFGSLVLLASLLTRLSDRTGFPVLATGMLILGLLTGLNTDFNALRSLPNEDGDQRLTMSAAITAWKKANACSADCPRPLVIAIDGGASRAAFTAATFIGELLDGMPTPASGEAASPGRRIFAISGVSGGAYGAAVVQSALADAQRLGDAKTSPCKSAQTTWFGYGEWNSKAEHKFTWRQCLQALTSGDYLSPTIIGLAFRDFFAPPWHKVGLPAMSDRAALLEKTWERQYSATLDASWGFYEGGHTCEKADSTGLCRRAAHAAAFLAEDSSSPRWIPLLLLNGTSVATGRRIISADLASSKIGKDGEPPGGSLYSQAFDLREVMSDQCKIKPPPIEQTEGSNRAKLQAASQDNVSKRSLTEGVCAEPDARIEGPDVRLSTAALTSARFPLISPAGIFNMEKTIYGDQVVDGGYFENSGLSTAGDIVAALRKNGIEPALVSISNNPAYSEPSSSQLEACEGTLKRNDANQAFSPAICTGLPRRPALTPLEPPIDNTFLDRFLGLFLRPFQTLVATGDGHADQVMAKILADPPPGGFFHLKVDVTPQFAESEDPSSMLADPACEKFAGKTMTMTKVSMSWWLAAAVQADLDVQRCSRVNRQELKRLHDMLGQRIKLP